MNLEGLVKTQMADEMGTIDGEYGDDCHGLESYLEGSTYQGKMVE